MDPSTGPETLLTYADYERIPEDGMRHEIIGGAHYMTPSPIPRHQLISGELLVLLHGGIVRSGRGKVFAAPTDVLLSPHDIVVPDLFVVLSQRLSIVGPRYVSGAPDLVVEIGSPSTQKRDRGEKLSLYARRGVSEYWMLPHDEDVVLQHVLEEDRLVLRGRMTDAITLSIVPDLTLDLTHVWRRT